MGEVVKLSHAEMLRCWTTASERFSIKDPATNHQVSPRSGREIHFDGLRLEVGLCGYIGRPDLVDFNNHLHGDGGVTDFTVNGCRIQAKASLYEPPYLRFDKEGKHVFAADIAVLGFVPLLLNNWQEATKEQRRAWFEANNYVDLVGWITRDEFFQRAEIMDFGYGERLVVKPPLQPMTTLLRELG